MKNKIIGVSKILFILLTTGISFYLIALINDLSMLPSKYYYPLLFIVLLLNVLVIVLIIQKKTWLNIIGIIIDAILISVSIFGIRYLKITLNYLNQSFNNNNVQISAYNVIVLNDSNYNELKDLNNKIIGYTKNDLDKNNYLEEIKIDFNRSEYSEIHTLYDDLLNKKIDSVIIEEAYLDLLEDSDENLFSKIKILHSFDIKKETEKSKDVKKLESINILISGSDSRSASIPSKSRSDVNMIMTINPGTKTILLTSIPRDYYVMLHGTSGLKDKLTHSGIYGVDITKRTLEDLFGIDIDYTVKVGFQSVIKVVDLIGGIDINSDQAFYSHCGDGGAKQVYVKMGMNHFTGAEALSYARERYAYTSGDRHRILNQQQVLEAIMTKIFKDKSILLKYDEFLSAFSNFYITDIPASYIKLFVKNQLSDMSSWNIIKQSVDGSGAMNQTYSMPGMNLYVMIPNQSSVNEATKKINEIKQS